MGDTPPHDWDSWSDEDLVKLAVVRTEGRMSRAWAAFEQLYVRGAQEVYNTIYYYLSRRHLSDHDMAQELTGKTFERAWHTLPLRNSQSPFVPWIKLVGLNEARQYMRQQQKITDLTTNTSIVPPTSLQKSK